MSSPGCFTSRRPSATFLLGLLCTLLPLSARSFTTFQTSSSWGRTSASARRIATPSVALPRVVTSSLSAAKDYEEDLELTRQIILQHMKETEGAGLVDDEDVAASSSAPSSERPENDLMIRTALGEPTTQTPVWLFRQAGRHLPEYQAYKEKTGCNFLELLASPQNVAECTLQPCRRYAVDAAILFSDILVVPQALGIEVTMPGGVGIQVPHPLTEPSEIKERLPEASEITPAFVRDKLSHVLEAVRQIRSQMRAESISIPLIGFSAAPWTLFYYMLGGSSKKNTDIGVKWLEEHPAESKELLDLLTKIVIEYMSAQVDAGCHMLQVFEAMGMMIDEANFNQHAMPLLRQMATELKRRHPNIPLMVFARGASYANAALADSDYDVVTLDGSVDRATARQVVGDESVVALQGNYDPAELIEANGKTVETVRASAADMLQTLGPRRLIANLGEGLGGKESPALVDAFVNAIHEESSKLMASS